MLLPSTEVVGQPLVEAALRAVAALSGPLALAYAACWAALSVHELGHAAAARALGVRVWSVQLGVGPALLAGRLGGARVRVGAFPLAGAVALVDADAAGIGYRDLAAGRWRFEWVPGAWRAPVISAAGGVANFLAAALALGLWPAAGPAGPLALCVAAANLAACLNLVPCFSSDGAKLLAHLSAFQRARAAEPGAAAS